MRNNKKRGFTLIELLVVVAIIGILASVILVSLGSARAKARDARRISDIKQLQSALEMYFSSYNRYPKAIEFTPAVKGTCGDGDKCLAPEFIPSMPTDPLGDPYKYAGLGIGTTAKCLSYHLGATLESATADSPVLQTDSDKTIDQAKADLCVAGQEEFDAGPTAIAAGKNCKGEVGVAGVESCYDVTP